MTQEEKKTITWDKHPRFAAQGHKLTALINKRKEEILRDKEQYPEQPTVQSTVQSTIQSTLQSTVQSTVQSSVQWNGTYVYDAGTLAVLAIGVCIFLYIKLLRLQKKKKSMKNKINHQNEVIYFRSDDKKSLIQ